MGKTKSRLIQTSVIIVIIATIGYAFITNVSFDLDDYSYVGKEAPIFSLPDLNGNQIDLADYKGKGVYLTFGATY
jgi:hypothetical protein